MEFGTIVFACGFLFFAMIWIYESIKSLKELITHWGFRITSDNTVEHEFTQKKNEEALRRILREEFSNALIKHLDNDKNRKNRS